MTKFSGFILVDTLSIVFQFIFVHGIDQFTAVLFLGDLRTHKCCLPQEWNLFFTVMWYFVITYNTYFALYK